MLAGTLETLLLVATRKSDERARCIGAVCELSVHASSHAHLMHHGLLPLLAAYARAVDSTLRYECVQAAYNLTVVAHGGAVPLREDDDAIAEAASKGSGGDGKGPRSGGSAVAGISYGALSMSPGSSREEQMVVAGVASALTIGSLFRSDDPVIMDLSCLALLNLAYCPRARHRLLEEGVLWAMVKLGADGRTEAERAQEDDAEQRVMAVARSRHASNAGSSSPNSDVVGIRAASPSSTGSQEGGPDGRDQPDGFVSGGGRGGGGAGRGGDRQGKPKRGHSLLQSPHGIISRRRSVRTLKAGPNSKGTAASSRKGSPLRQPGQSPTNPAVITLQEGGEPRAGVSPPPEHAFDFASLEGAGSDYAGSPMSKSEAAAREVTGESTTASEALRLLAADPFARTHDRQLTCTRFLRALAASGSLERKALSDKRTLDAIVAFATSPHPLVRVDAGIIVSELARDSAVAGLAVRRGAVAAVWELMLQPDLPCAVRAAAALLRMCCQPSAALAIATTGNTAVPLLTSFFSYADRLLRRGADHGALARGETGTVSTPQAAGKRTAPQPFAPAPVMLAEAPRGSSQRSMDADS